MYYNKDEQIGMRRECRPFESTVLNHGFSFRFDSLTSLSAISNDFHCARFVDQL